MKISGDWIIHPGTQALCHLLEGAGWKALMVGGCVRNALLSEPVTDIDIATDALPETVISLAQKAGMKAVPTGVDHGTVTVIAQGKPHEVTTLRRDVATDGRHALVAFSTDVSEDAARRDFTMNALYADRSGQVFDPLGGLADLLSRRVRFVGDPERRIREDYLRILRFFRIHAQYGDPKAGLDSDGLRACALQADGLSTLSRERVGAEMKKLLSAKDPIPSLLAMEQTGVLRRLLPGADLESIARLVRLEGDESPDWLRRLACLSDGADFDLRLSRAEVRRISRIRKAAMSSLGPAALGWMLGPVDGKAAAFIMAAKTGTGLPLQWLAQVERGASLKLPVRAEDLLPLEGPLLGQRLRDIQDRWLKSDLRLTREELLR